jgi:predicted glycoside hydrolase/deacetylase ChbG (UPF0249 family)
MTPKRIIVNADDYGLCHEISSGIVAAAIHGIVTATSVVSVGEDYAKGRGDLRESGLDTGIHLTFVGGETPLTGPIGGLVDASGNFLQDYTRVIPKILAGQFDAGALRNELMLQTARLHEDGFLVSHIDAHQHLHVLPPIVPIVAEIATRFQIPWVRRPMSRRWNIQGMGINFFSRLAARRFKRIGLRMTDHFEGFDVSGSLDQKALQSILDRAAPGTTELMTHPGINGTAYQGWKLDWANEHRALTSQATHMLIRSKRILLTNFRDIQ